jgi:hypothetical protein
MSRKSLQSRITVVFFALIVAFGAFAKDEIGRATGGGSHIEWQSHITGHQKITLRVLDRYGDTLQLSFGPGANPVFRIADLGGSAEDGQYTYELRVEPTIPKGLQKKLDEARANGDDAAIRKIQKENGLGQAITQSGVITIKNNMIVSPEGKESTAKDTEAESQSSRFGGEVETNGARPGEVTVNDQVIPDDLIVQSSTCTGFDCVDGESFGVDTLRLKENNLRINFLDTSSSAGFASNDWRIVANEQPSGGANMFSIEDSTAGRNLMLIEAGAPANSIYVDSTGNIGFQQSAPGLDLHLTTSDTPALRLDQSNAGGFTAQTWDIGGNEANFFIRDLTGGSRLSFRIRPGAPTSSIDIAGSGNVGIGTASPAVKLDIQGTTAISGGDLGIGTTAPAAALHIIDDFSANSVGRIQNTNSTGFSGFTYFDNGGTARMYAGTDNAGLVGRVATFSTFPLVLVTNNVERMRVDTTGRVGIGAGTTLTQPFMVGVAASGTGGNGAHVTAGGVWTSTSSRALKEHIEELTADEALAAVAALKPVRYNYKIEPQEQYVGFIAEDVPELVAQTSTDRKFLSPMDVVATLTKVVQEQQKTIEQLSKKVDQLEKNQ